MVMGSNSTFPRVCDIVGGRALSGRNWVGRCCLLVPKATKKMRLEKRGVWTIALQVED